MTPEVRAKLEVARAAVEADTALLLDSHGRTRPGCQGYHQRTRPLGRVVAARHIVMFDGGLIHRLCARCAYGLDGMDIVGRLPLRYPK